MDAELSILEIEREKLAIERKKLDVEYQRVRWTAISTTVPLIAALLTVGFGFWATYEQGRFLVRLEVTKAILQAPTFEAAGARVEVFKSVLGESFPLELGSMPKDAFDPQEFVRGKEEFIRVIASRGLSPKQVKDVWGELFPTDRFAQTEGMRKILESTQ